jgi:predicted transcriptional regulator
MSCTPDNQFRNGLLSQRDVAKVLEVSNATVSRDLQDVTESVAKRNTRADAIRQKNAALKLVYS